MFAGAVFKGNMYLSQQTTTGFSKFTEVATSDQQEKYANLKNDQESGKNLLIFNSICSVIDTHEISSRKSIELLYEQWRSLTNVLNTCILAACNQSNYIKQTFQNEYPKLLKLQNDFWTRLLQMSPLIDRYRWPIDNQNEKNRQKGNLSKITDQLTLASVTATSFVGSYELLRKCFYDLENAYLNRSLSHLFEPINLIFSQSVDKQINRNDVETFIKAIQLQLQHIQCDQFNSINVTMIY